MNDGAAQQNRRDDLSAGYGDLLLHAENPVNRVRKRTVLDIVIDPDGHGTYYEQFSNLEREQQ